MTRTKPAPPPAQSSWAYFLDFDGTLLDLAITPDAIHIDAALPVLLTRLHQVSNGAVALISGRSLSDLERRLGLPAIPKAGQHGLERRDAAGHLWRHTASSEAKLLIRDALEPILERHCGLLLEDKGLTLALHYRQAPELSTYLQQLVGQLVTKAGEAMVVQEGKCIVEVKPAGVDKGTAIAEYMAEPPFLGRKPVFIGDDKNDEQGFVEVNERRGISIDVGGNSYFAGYCLPDVLAVRTWLAGAIEE